MGCRSKNDPGTGHWRLAKKTHWRPAHCLLLHRRMGILDQLAESHVRRRIPLRRSQMWLCLGDAMLEKLLLLYTRGTTTLGETQWHAPPGSSRGEANSTSSLPGFLMLFYGKNQIVPIAKHCRKTSAHGSQISTSLRELRMQAARGDDGSLCSRRSSIELTSPAAAKTVLAETKATSHSSCCSSTQKVTKTESVHVASKPACCAPSSPASPSRIQMPAQKSSLSKPESAPTSSVPWLDTLKCQGAGSMWTMLTEPLTTPPMAQSWQPWSPHQATFAPSHGIPCEVFYTRLSPPG